MATVAASAAVLYGVYNVGQVTSAKQKVVNATDAAALAGANQQARMLNLMAYNNRAMIAADVVVAQAVSLDSWLRFVHQASQNASVVLSWVPYVGAALNRIESVVQRIEEGYGRGVSVMLTGEGLLKRSLDGVNTAIRAGGGALSNVTANDVVEANRTVFNGRVDQAPQVSTGIGAVAVGANLVAWNNFTERFTNDNRTRAREVLVNSVDEFSGVNGRNGNRVTNLSALFLRVEKQGTTQLVGFNRWEAQDAWDLRARGCGFFRTRWCGTTAPLGWGRADAYNNDNRFRDRIGNTSATNLAYAMPRDFSNWTGVPVVTDLTASAQSDPQLTFISVAAKPLTQNRTTTSLGIAPQPVPSPLGSGAMPERMLSNQVTAISEAVVYFERPQRGIGDWTADAWGRNAALHRQDNTKEYASLFNPFWQARLAPVSATRKNALIAALGAPGLATSNQIGNMLP